MKFAIEDFFSKCDQIRRFLRIWSHLLKKSLMENFIFCAVRVKLFHQLKQEPSKQLAFNSLGVKRCCLFLESCAH